MAILTRIRCLDVIISPARCLPLIPTAAGICLVEIRSFHWLYLETPTIDLLWN